MTTVVAVARDGQVHMAADSVTNVYDVPVLEGGRKIVRRPAGGRREVLLGVTGDAGMAALLDQADLSYLEPPVHGDDVLADRAAFKVAQQVTGFATAHGLVEDGRMSGNVLLGWAGRVWTLGHHFAIRHIDGVAALGSGHGFAFGAVDALLGAGIAAADAVVKACQVAIDRDRYSGGPVQYERLSAAGVVAR